MLARVEHVQLNLGLVCEEFEACDKVRNQVADFLQRAVDAWRRNHAFLHRHQSMRAFFEVPEASIGEMELAAIAIAVFGSGDDINGPVIGELADALKLLAQDLDLPIELCRVLGMLILASATSAEMRARRGDPLRGIGKTLKDFRLHAAAGFSQTHLFARQDVGSQ